MNISSLPSELISLVHHIELNKVGWWDKAVQRFLLTTIWLIGKPTNIDEINDNLTKILNLNIEKTSIKAHIEELFKQSTLIPLPDGSIKLSEVSLKEFENQLVDAERAERCSKERFIKALKTDCSAEMDAEQVWNDFIENLFIPTIKGLGAKTYELIAGDITERNNFIKIDDFLVKYPIDVHKNIRCAINSFLDPSDAFVRTFILGLLNTYFFLEASHLREDTIDKCSSPQLDRTLSNWK